MTIWSLLIPLLVGLNCQAFNSPSAIHKKALNLIQNRGNELIKLEDLTGTAEDLKIVTQKVNSYLLLKFRDCHVFG